MLHSKHYMSEPINMPSNDTNSENQPVESIDNHIYFYSDISPDSCLNLIKELRRVDNEMKSMSYRMKTEHPIPIWLHIQSYGGGLFEAIGLTDQIEMISSPVYAIVEGVVASAATVIVMSCTKTFILPSSFFMVHQLSSYMWGKYEEFKDEMALQDQLMEWLTTFYSEKTGAPKKKIKEMLKRDSWMSASEAVENKFIHEIYK